MKPETKTKNVDATEVTSHIKNNLHSVRHQWLFPMLRVLWLVLLAGAFAVVTPISIATEEEPDRVEWFGGAPTDRWVYGGEFYLWAAGVEGETAGGDDIDISFTDLAKDMEFGIMGILAAAKGKWTLFADLIYLDVDEDDKTTANVAGFPLRYEVDAELEAFITTFGVAHSVLEINSTRLNLLAGARYLWLDGELEFDIGPFKTKVSDSEHYWDGIIGFRGKTGISEKWYLTYYADVGTGDSDLTWQTLAAISYRFEKLDAVLGYRYLEYDFDDDNDVFDDLNLGGPFAGVKVRF